MDLDWLFHPFRHRARAGLLAAPFPPAWLPLVEPLPFYRALDARGQQRIRDDLRVLVAEKAWEGCGGLVLTDEIRVTIAATASLLLLDIEHDYYPQVRTILVYPRAWRKPAEMDAFGNVREASANLGEAWSSGQVVLAWDAAQRGVRDPHDGHNVVLHEFAHQLDLLDGAANGAPPLRGNDYCRQWQTTMAAEFATLQRAAAGGRATLLDAYGATNPAEFFAVATECFFERSRRLAERHPQLYEVLRAFSGQDPAGRSG
ncbi:MAG: M90 family metallopeptidase [Planctomycetota bacterium]